MMLRLSIVVLVLAACPLFAHAANSVVPAATPGAAPARPAAGSTMRDLARPSATAQPQAQPATRQQAPQGQPPSAQQKGQGAGAARDANGDLHPCKKVVGACKAAGFGPGKAGVGLGLFVDCVNPLMQGKTDVPGAKAKLPTLAPNIVADCKASRPKFGRGPVGSTGK